MLHVIDLSRGTTRWCVPAGGQVVSGLQWASEGKYLAYAAKTAASPPRRVRVLDVRSGAVSRPGGDVSGDHPILSPDAGHVYYSGEGGIWYARRAASAAAQPAAFRGIFRTPATPWSHAADLFFQTSLRSSGGELQYALLSRSPQGLVTARGLQSGLMMGPIRFDHRGRALAVTISPTTPPHAQWTDDRELWCLDTTSGSLRFIAGGRLGRDIAWMPDNKGLVVTLARADIDYPTLCTVDVATGQITELRLANGDAVTGAWPQTTLDPPGVVFSWREAAWLYTYRDRRCAPVFDSQGRVFADAAPTPTDGGEARATPGWRDQESTQEADRRGSIVPETVKLANMQFVRVPAGRFRMGCDAGDWDERPAHEVEVEAFLLSVYEVTNTQYQGFLDATGHPSPGADHLDAPEAPGPDHPVVQVTWEDATAFCDWLTRKTGKQIALPTEAQWEYAARGPAGLVYPWGNTWHADWCCSRSYPGPGGTTCAVGANERDRSWCGAYDMAGNVWEWCRDEFSPYPHAPSGVFSYADRHVVRGGSWGVYDGQQFRTTERNAGMGLPGTSDPALGFRVVVETSAPATSGQ